MGLRSSVAVWCHLVGVVYSPQAAVRSWGRVPGQRGSSSLRTWGWARLQQLAHIPGQRPSRAYHTLESELRRWVSAVLVVADQTQHLAEAGRGQEAAVFRVCDLPNLAQHGRRKLRTLEELDSDLACDDTELFRIGLLEEILECTLLVRREVEDGMVCIRSAPLPSQESLHDDVLSSPLAARSAMAVGGRAMDGGGACDEAGAPGCRGRGRGSRRPGVEVGGLAKQQQK